MRHCHHETMSPNTRIKNHIKARELVHDIMHSHSNMQMFMMTQKKQIANVHNDTPNGSKHGHCLTAKDVS